MLGRYTTGPRRVRRITGRRTAVRTPRTPRRPVATGRGSSLRDRAAHRGPRAASPCAGPRTTPGSSSRRSGRVASGSIAATVASGTQPVVRQEGIPKWALPASSSVRDRRAVAQGSTQHSGRLPAGRQARLRPPTPRPPCGSHDPGRPGSVPRRGSRHRGRGTSPVQSRDRGHYALRGHAPLGHPTRSRCGPTSSRRGPIMRPTRYSADAHGCDRSSL